MQGTCREKESPDPFNREQSTGILSARPNVAQLTSLLAELSFISMKICHVGISLYLLQTTVEDSRARSLM